MRRLVFIVLAVLVAGCLQPVAKLGCCLKENLSEGCVLYNTTDFQPYDYTGFTNGPCDDPDSNTSGHCNVTIGEKDYLIPICTQDQLVPCIAPNCTAMVCGDFTFTPRIAPGFISIEESEGDVPPNLEEAPAAQFHKARCEFLPMDADLRNIMKNTKSQINVFRVGVGGSFDEYDQYRYFFPMSDKFCNINPPQDADDLRVDRYMNYLTPDLEDYDPVTDITENCLDDSGAVPAPFGFSEDSAPRDSEIKGRNFPYEPVVPDKSNYNFSHYGRLDYESRWTSAAGGYYQYNKPFTDQFSVYKKIDEEFYRRELSIAHAETIYGLTSANTTRAPFECNIAGYDCYSGSCDIRVYNRGVLVEFPGALQGGDEVVADCAKVEDANGLARIICAPTKSVSVSGSGLPPARNYAKVDAIPAHIEGDENKYYKFQSYAQNNSLLDERWMDFSTSDYATDSYEGATRIITRTSAEGGISFEYIEKKDCPWDYGVNDDTTRVWCSFTEVAPSGPPAGGAVFFGKLKDDATVRYMGETIIGYAIASPGEFENMMVVKNCGLDMTEESTFPPPPDADPVSEPEFYTACILECQGLCPAATPGECSDYCYGGGAVAPPCTPPPPSILTNTDDFVRVELSGPEDPDWRALMIAFKPYFKEMTSAMTLKGFKDGCGKRLNAYDPIIASMPWVINYDKGMRNTGGSRKEMDEMEYLASISAQGIRELNTYDEPMTEHSRDTSSCELRRSTMPWNLFRPSYYNLLFSKHIYLFKYDEGSKMLGDCAVDDVTYLPEMKTFGWCEPCTSSTLAFQELETVDRVYMPGFSGNIEGSSSTNEESICESEYDIRGGFWGYTAEDNVSCFNPYITDIDDYQGSIGGIGSPRTVPEASVLKERLGNYMKSGVMPVLDLSDDSNWNISNPDFDIYPGFKLFWWTSAASPGEYDEYDFERLIGEMGAAVVIVDHISGNATADEVEQIAERSSIVKEKCFGCIVALHVDKPMSNESLRDSLDSVFLADPWADVNIDMVTFDYPASEHFATLFGGKEVAGEIASYGRMALQSWGKPTMVVGLNIQTHSGWTADEYESFFVDIITEQDQLVKAGVIGVIYSPARTSATSGMGSEGLVKLDSTGVGSKGDKFCAFQQAAERMTAEPPTALFTRTAVMETVNCTKCTSIEKIQGNCDMACENGIACGLPVGVIDGTGEYKCPDGVVVAPCQLCNESGSTYTCTLSHANGTVQTISGPMSDVSSDIYMDVIAGIPKPDKCCLQDNEYNYTFTKQSFASPVSRPIAFSETGDPNADCGFGQDTGVIRELSTFCGMETLSVSEYDINCTIG
jgi:predicted RNA-binding Zn-ribbon protein involved in translation (DUF1610 family)